MTGNSAQRPSKHTLRSSEKVLVTWQLGRVHPITSRGVVGVIYCYTNLPIGAK